MCAILGVVVTSAAQVIYGVNTWNPLQVSVLMDRAPMFFSAFCWALSVIATNISANTTAVANDLMLAFPKYINIRRGQYICIIIALASTPWNIQNSAKSFVSFLSGYSVFLGPPCGILLADFWIVRKQRLNLVNLYRLGPGTELYYWHGFNMRAVTAFFCGIIPTLPGFIRAIGGAKMGIAIQASYIYCCVWPVGVTIAGAVYVALNMAFPYRYEAVSSVVERRDSEEEVVDEINLDDEEKKY
jgi:NCS1 family nucleobase:cation symporter-1